MAKYYVNNEQQTNGDHEVHRDDCLRLPSNKHFLGEYSNCADAVKAAKKIYPRSNGCYWCSKECHTS